MSGARNAKSVPLGLPGGDGGASVPLSWSAATAAGAARVPLPKNESSDVS